MTRDIDCQVFDDQLGALLQDTLPEEGKRQLQLHAARCPDCAMQLRVHEHLALPSLEELETEVPSELVDSMWPSVQTAIQADGRDQRPGPAPARFGWLVPALAAASVALLLSTAFLFRELGRIQAREIVLAQQIVELEEGLAAVDGRTELVERTANLGAPDSWVLALSRQERISVVSLRDRLRSLPADAPLLDASQVDALLRSAPTWTPAGWRNALRRLRAGDGVSVQDLLGILDSSTVNPETTIPTAPLIDLLS
ncbi:MAG: zf-HC2 domain-containing protein [Gemmatimonadota bacterium]